jgi:hypothetical protein
MAYVVFRFVKPNSLTGKLICWRLGEPWSHVVVLFDEAAFSSEIPKVVERPLIHKSVAMPPREGRDVILEVTTSDYEKMKDWCESQLGKTYDFASILGWLFGWSWLQCRKNTYCFEYVRECLEHMGWLKPNDALIKGNRLIQDIEALIETHVTSQAQSQIMGIGSTVDTRDDDQTDKAG